VTGSQRSSVASPVAIIASNFWPEQTGTSQTLTEFARFLVAAGVPVRVATAMPYYPQWRIWPRYRGRLWSTDREGGLTVLRSWHLVGPKPSTVTRLLHEATLSLFAVPRIVAALRGASVVYVASPDLGYAFVGMLLARAFAVRRVLIVKDVMPDAAVELGMLRNRFVIAVSRLLARLMYRWADEIHTLGEGMRRRIAQQTRAAAKIRIVPDTIDAAELQPVPVGQNEFRGRYVPEGTFAVLHTGNMGKKQDLHLLLRAARRLRNDGAVQFYVFGDGAAKDEFLGLKERWGLRNVSHYPLQDRRMVAHMLSGADLVLISQMAEIVDIVVPSKLITALGAGAMVVAACAPDSETAQLIKESNGGLLVAAGDDVALVDTIRRIRTGGVDTDGYRRRARLFGLRYFDRTAVYGPLADAHLRGNETGRNTRSIPRSKSAVQFSIEERIL
jgi:putative colanic acid biosynthesis glycosyltransferase WcaI